MKKILSVILVFVMIISLTSCGSSSKSLVGTWEYNSNQSKWSMGSALLSKLVFFSDGTYSSSIGGYSGSYTAEGNILRLSGDSRGDMVFSYTINGNTLTLDDDKGYDHWVYDRVK